MLQLGFTMTFLGISQQFDSYVATLNDARVDKVMKFYPKNGTCFIPPNHVSVGWCSKGTFLYTKKQILSKVK